MGETQSFSASTMVKLTKVMKMMEAKKLVRIMGMAKTAVMMNLSRPWSVPVNWGPAPNKQISRPRSMARCDFICRIDGTSESEFLKLRDPGGQSYHWLVDLWIPTPPLTTVAGRAKILTT